MNPSDNWIIIKKDHYKDIVNKMSKLIIENERIIRELKSKSQPKKYNDTI